MVPPRGEATGFLGMLGRGRRRTGAGPMAVAESYLAGYATQVGRWPRPGPSPPRLGSGSGNSYASGTDGALPGRPAELGHGASGNLDPHEGGSLAERWVGRGGAGLEGSWDGTKEKENGSAEFFGWLVSNKC